MKLTRTHAVSAAIGGAIVLALAFLGGCAKITEPLKDAQVSHRISGPAEVGSMPDGFNNFAEKCDDHGNRIFVIFHGDGTYGSVFAMRYPTCRTAP